MIDFRSRAMLLFDLKKEISPKLKYQINFGEISEFQAHSNKPTYFIP
ncbi:hypothetical protein psyc5s11_36860 [Clostridium gelidum]|uniref:Uncharacterized protein n=1 Tax=Clostridium gelidum TaxID=704125 RepID=A0ABM7TF28_9CLOT|nr:hypothetical protein psyc5s11_36860 [Clostridium gelidum]